MAENINPDSIVARGPEIAAAARAALERMGVSQANMNAAGPSDTTTSSTFGQRAETAPAAAKPQISPELLKALFSQISTAQVDPTLTSSSTPEAKPIDALAKAFLKALTTITAGDLAAVIKAKNQHSETDSFFSAIETMPVLGGIISKLFKETRSLSIGAEGDARLTEGVRTLQQLQRAILLGLDSNKVADLLKASTKDGLEKILASQIKSGSIAIHEALNLTLFNLFQEFGLKDKNIKNKTDFDSAAQAFAESIKPGQLPQIIATRTVNQLLTAITQASPAKDRADGGFLLNANQALYDFGRANSLSFYEGAIPNEVETSLTTSLESIFKLFTGAEAKAKEVFEKALGDGAPEVLRKIASQLLRVADVAENRGKETANLRNSLPVLPASVA